MIGWSSVSRELYYIWFPLFSFKDGGFSCHANDHAAVQAVS